MMSLKQIQALALYYSGKSKTSIRKKLNVKVKRLNKWIEEGGKQKSIRSKAILVHIMRCNIHNFCEKYLLSEAEYYSLINESYNLESDRLKKLMDRSKFVDIEVIIQLESEEVTKPIVTTLVTRPKGYSSWVDELFRNAIRKNKAKAEQSA